MLHLLRSRREEPLGAHLPERLAFVLHDMFALPFDEIAPIVGHSPTAAKAARKPRRWVDGRVRFADLELTRRREVEVAFLAASPGGNFDALVSRERVAGTPTHCVRVRAGIAAPCWPSSTTAESKVAATSASTSWPDPPSPLSIPRMR